MPDTDFNQIIIRPVPGLEPFEFVTPMSRKKNPGPTLLINAGPEI